MTDTSSDNHGPILSIGEGCLEALLFELSQEAEYAVLPLYGLGWLKALERLEKELRLLDGLHEW